MVIKVYIASSSGSTSVRIAELISELLELLAVKCVAVFKD